MLDLKKGIFCTNKYSCVYLRAGWCVYVFCKVVQVSILTNILCSKARIVRYGCYRDVGQLYTKWSGKSHHLWGLKL